MSSDGTCSVERSEMESDRVGGVEGVGTVVNGNITIVSETEREREDSTRDEREVVRDGQRQRAGSTEGHSTGG